MNSEHDALSQLWQEIETEPEFSAEQLSTLARRNKLKNQLILGWDIFVSLAMVGLLYLALINSFSYVVIGWLALATLFSIWLTIRFNQYRKVGVQALTISMSGFNQYLIDKANTDIRVGKLFNIANALVSVSMISVFIYEQWFSGRPIVSEGGRWLFVIGWSVTWISLLFAYGWWKINRGKKSLERLREHFEN